MTYQHFESENELRDFVTKVANDSRDDAIDWGTYEVASAFYADHDLCPWSITTHLDSNVPFDELSGPDPRDMIEHEAYLCLEIILNDIYEFDE